MLHKTISMFVFLLMLCSCAVLPPDEVLKNSSASYERKNSVSIPVLKVNLEIKNGDKEHSIFLTGKVMASQPDKLRMKLTKANYHLVTLVVNGHDASLYFPRTGKVLNKELNKPVLDENEDVDILASAIELCMIFLQGPFPEYPVTGYEYMGKDDDCYVYETDVQGGRLALYIDSSTSQVRKRVYKIKGKESWTVELHTGMYRKAGVSMFPRKFRLVLTGPAEKKFNATVEMFVSRISFNKRIPDKAYSPSWPAETVVIEKLPSNTEELFGKMEEEDEEKENPEIEDGE